ncbi:prosaposin [Narcine bancroftii]|uniref:prosaposin n=1 Tax=Narcine bancroftii TaxID=1343680 RepID=UPI003831DB35
MAAALIVALCFGAAVAKPFSGQERCAEGPLFWCQNVKTASDCGAVKHCQQNVWRQPPVKSLSCDLCKDVMNVMRNLLKQNTSEEELRSYLAKACELLPNPTLTAQCNELVDDYLPIILNILKEELENPEVVCSAMGLCQTLQGTLKEKEILSNEIPEVDMSKIVSPFIANVPLLLYPQQTIKSKSNDVACLDCSQFITNIQTAMTHNTAFLDEVISQLKKQCNVGPGLTELCEKYIALQGPRVAEVLMQRSAEDICTMNGFCEKPATVPLQPLQKPIMQGSHPDLPCWTFGTTMSSSSRRSAVHLAAGVVAAHTFHKENPVSAKDFQECLICEFVMKEIDTLLQQNTTEEVIIDALLKILPATVKEECADFLDQYGKVLIQLLVQKVDPARVCTFLGVCKKPKDLVVDPIKTKPSQLEVQVFCEVCKEMVEYLDNLLEENRTEEMIMVALKKVCSLMPKSVLDECNDLINQYGSLLLQLLLQSLDPAVVCRELGVCREGNKHLLGADKCVWGPSYWCMNMETANLCNAVEHCKSHIWK